MSTLFRRVPRLDSFSALILVMSFALAAIFPSETSGQRRPAQDSQASGTNAGEAKAESASGREGIPSLREIIKRGESFTAIQLYDYDVTYLTSPIYTIISPNGQRRDSLVLGNLTSTPVMVNIGYGLTIPVKALSSSSSLCVLPGGQIGFSLFTDPVVGSLYNISIPAYFAFKYGTDALYPSGGTDFGISVGIGGFGGVNFSPNTYGAIPFITPSAMLEVNGVLGNGDLYKLRAQFGFISSKVDTRTDELLEAYKNNAITKIYGTAELTPTFGVSLCRVFNY